MRIERITKPLHAVQLPSKPERVMGRYQGPKIWLLSDKALNQELCHPANDVRYPPLCSRKCENISVCEFGKEYLRRVERKHDGQSDFDGNRSAQGAVAHEGGRTERKGLTKPQRICAMDERGVQAAIANPG